MAKLNFMGFLKVAAKAGPVVYALARQLAPQIQRMIAENPEAYSALFGRFRTVLGVKGGAKQQGLTQRCVVLRDQVTYLYASANNAEVAKKTVAWRNELEALERAIPVLNAMSRRKKVMEKRQIEKRLDILSSEILAASLVDTVEDADIVSDPSDGGQYTASEDGQYTADH
ncbi:MAG: hypothetical protein LKJ57_03655 [Ancrocorticia sp.]|jgi:hypothetical protein|nr:hypothetical protein [Ancrocorticia sp.]MCI1895441.1 hypothetical protein [Ancrocorticia sp.]MCI1932114.1 hypothetical protein [Ancrocorticia sp.]MCI1963474.1 hypothetical protein [Ancrocorticia sp.]MCI2002332.1 hypothetical protein [Ancrocorticia sp.]